MDDRVKTDIRLTEFLGEEVRELSSLLGISKNAFYTISISLMVAIAQTFLDRKRGILPKNVGSEFRKFVDRLF